MPFYDHRSHIILSGNTATVASSGRWKYCHGNYWRSLLLLLGVASTSKKFDDRDDISVTIARASGGNRSGSSDDVFLGINMKVPLESAIDSTRVLLYKDVCLNRVLCIERHRQVELYVVREEE